MRLLVGVLGAVLALGTPAVAAAPEGVILSAAAPIAGSYLVVLRDHGSASAAGPTSRNGFASAAGLALRYGGNVGRVFTSALHGFEIAMPAAAARRLAADPAVAYVQQNGTVHIDTSALAKAEAAQAGALGTQPSPPSWGLDRIDQRNLPLDSSYSYPNTAANVHAYILSTGIRPTHVDFGGRVVHGRDTVDNDNDATDCNGHGTNVAGIVGGTAHGVAKGVTLVAMRMLNCAGSASFAQVIAGIDWVTANAVKPAVAVLVAGGPTNAAFNAAVRNSIASGITYTVIAGSNNANACGFSPGGVPEAITVAATDRLDNRHSASNFGTCLDIFAPGIGVTTTAWTSDTATVTISGTSFATAHAGGVAAMIASAHPTWTPQQVRDQMIADATPGVVVNPGAGSPNFLVYVNNSGAPPPCTATNAGNVSIPDYPAAAVSSSVTLTGCAGSASATSSAEVHIVHPFRGDLQIDLIAPDGTAHRLQSTSADSGDDIHTTYVVNLSSEARNGLWRLQMRDQRAANTGYLDSWTLRL